MRKAAVRSERTKMKDVNVPAGTRPPLEQVSDEVLAGDAKAGNTEAYGELVRRYWKVAFAAAFAELGDTHIAEDVAQQGFLVGFQRLHQLRSKGRYASWILKIVTNDARRARKRSRSRPVRFSDSAPTCAHEWPTTTQRSGLRQEPQTDPSIRLLEAEGKAKVWEAMRRLRPKDRAVVLLRYFEGLSFTAISKRTGQSQGVLRVQLHRSLSRLKRELRHYFEEG